MKTGIGTRGRRIAIGSGALALAVVLATAFILRDEVRWRWRTWGAVKVEVFDGFLCPTLADALILEGPAAVARAREATRRLIGSIPRAKPSDLVMAGHFSSVGFLSSADPGSQVLGVLLTSSRDGEFEVDLGGVRYACEYPRWLDYLRDILTPQASRLTSRWSGPSSGRQFDTAWALALAAPGTEGLTEFFRGSLRIESQRGYALNLLQAMGPRAAAAAPDVSALLQNSTNDHERDFLKEVLAAITSPDVTAPR